MLRNIALLTLFWLASSNCVKLYVKLDPSRGASIYAAQEGGSVNVPKDYVAKASFNDSISKTGWSFLEVQSNPNSTDEDQMYAAGFVEGYLTSDLIYKHWYNTMKDFCSGRDRACRLVQKFLDKNLQWIKANIEARADTDTYWHQVKLFYVQLKGIKDGYNKGIKDPSKQMSFNTILWHNIQGDLEDLPNLAGPSGVARGRVFGSGSCSALIKVLPNNSDLLVGHDTWSSYQNMLRVQKLYILPVREMASSETRVAGTAMAFSSYPGIITSGDDFYVISSGLVTLETTLGVNDDTLWRLLSPSTVLETVRSAVANRLAHGGRRWAVTFRRYNSGTYNNQWMAVDMERWRASRGESRIRPDVLWVLEQLPGIVETADRTDALRSNGYWPSYNSPSFPVIYNRSGVRALAEKYGDWFTYDRTPRALIFKRDHKKVHDLSSMLALMEYNDFRRDPLSQCSCDPPYSAENAIAARNDLNPANGSYPFPALGHRSHGSIDTKITSDGLARNLQMLSRSGPVFNSQLEPFRWSHVDFGPTTPHIGHPDLWQFAPLVHRWRSL